MQQISANTDFQAFTYRWTRRNREPQYWQQKILHVSPNSFLHYIYNTEHLFIV